MDSYNKRIFIEKNIDDKNILGTLKNHTYFKKCGILKLKKLKKVSKLLQNFKASRVFHHI
jgi:hypothetical protein